MKRLIIFRDTYYDSVFLMAISANLRRSSTLKMGQVLLATPANRQLLENEGFAQEMPADLGPTDLLIALKADTAQALSDGEVQVHGLLQARQSQTGGVEGAEAGVRSIGLMGGLRTLPDATLALISVPGEYAAYEAYRALDQGLQVMMFSDNVSLEEEVALKQYATEVGQLVMGPDCGTALIQGKPLGFANKVRPGSIGLVGASGTGMQEIACQIHHLGQGLSHMLGTGGRDLSREVGGLTTLAALEMLAADAATSVLVVVSKPPAPEVAEKILQRLMDLNKPSVVIFLGAPAPAPRRGPIHFARYLSEAAWIASQLAVGQSLSATYTLEESAVKVEDLARGLAKGQRFLHGLYSGGTLGAEALLLLRSRLGKIYSNLDHGTGDSLPTLGQGHTLTDLGDDQFTRGRPHPMIDPSLRAEWIVRLGGEASTAILLLDVVLGTGCHPDPASVVAEALTQARKLNPKLLCCASVTGTDLDAQHLGRSQAILRQAGTIICTSNIAAAHCAARLMEIKEERP